MSEHLEIKVYGPLTQPELDKLISSEAFNAPFIAYENQVLKECRDTLEGKDLQDFNTWWNGKVPADFWETVTPKAYNNIMRAISLGCG